MHEKIIKPSNSVPCQWCHPSYCTSTKYVYYQNGTNFFLNVIIKFHEKFTKILMWHIKLLYWLTIFCKYCRECFFWKTSFDWNSSESSFWYVFTIIILIIINLWIQHVTKVTKTFFRQILRLEYVTHNDHFVSYKHFADHSIRHFCVCASYMLSLIHWSYLQKWPNLCCFPDEHMQADLASLGHLIFSITYQ